MATTRSASIDAPTDVSVLLPTPVRSGWRLVVAVALAGTLVAVAAGCSGVDRAAPTTFTVPAVTSRSTTTTTFPSTPTTLPPPRAEQAGVSPGISLGGLSGTKLNDALDAIAATGVRWLRVDFDWSVIQHRNPQQFNWTRTDRIVDRAAEHNLSIIALVTYTPAWARPFGTPDKSPPSNPDAFATFVSAAAQRYAAKGVTSWEIWNEPNVSTFWYPRPDPEGYTALLVRAAAAIRAVDATATIISGGLSPASDQGNGSQIDVRTFLARVYAAGGGRAFDAVGMHPYSFPRLPSFPADYNAFASTPALYQVMVDHGDAAKQIWGTEIGAPTGGGGGSVTEAVQEQILIEAYKEWNAWPFAGPLIWFAFDDAGTNPTNRDDHYGLRAADGREKPALAAFRGVVRDLIAGQPLRSESPAG